VRRKISPVVVGFRERTLNALSAINSNSSTNTTAASRIKVAGDA